MRAADSLPIISLSDLAGSVVGGEATERLDAACRDTGFFCLVDHAIPEPVTVPLLARASRFFASDPSEKARIAIGNSSNHTGWIAPESEQLQPDLLPDRKEALDILLEPRALQPRALEPPAIVSQLPDDAEFVDAVTGYQAAALRTAATVLRAMALALGQQPRFFADRMTDPQCFLRVLHYPADPAENPESQLGCGAHTDYGLITLLLTDGTPGLQVQRRDGTWLDVEPPPGALVVNLGDMLARWTNDRYASTPHRVTSPADRSRYSVPFFVNPDPTTEIAVMATCVDGPVAYEPIKAGDYLQSRFDDTHAYRDETLSRPST